VDTIQITGGRVVDPSSGLDAEICILIHQGRVAGVSREPISEGPLTIDASGLLVLPGLVDVHTHLRTPGEESKEDLDSGTKAAAAGGFTTIVAMPNTDPAMDDPGLLALMRRQAQGLKADVLFAGAVSVGRKGITMSPMTHLARASAPIFTDDGNNISTAGLLRQALLQCSELGVAVADHCEDPSLVYDPGIAEGPIATSLGLRGVPVSAETAAVARDLAVAAGTGGRLHIQHISTEAALEMVALAKARGVRVTAEVTPHHLTLTSDDVARLGTLGKVNPPLRSARDRDALRRGLARGTIDMIATDHAPHLTSDKNCPFKEGKPGVIGLETCLSLACSLVEEGLLEWPDLARVLSLNPARLLGLDDRGSLSPGSRGDLILVDPQAGWTPRAEGYQSKSRNCPYAYLNLKLKGRVLLTVAEGRVVYEASCGGRRLVAGQG
jgi:dihydroorotase